MRNGYLALAFHTLFILFSVAPLMVICLVAFTDKGYLSMPFDGASLRWFYAILDNPEFIDAFWFSLYLGIASASIALVLSVPAALAISRHRFPGRDGINAFLLSPLMIPHLVLGVAFLRFFTALDLNGTFVGLVLAHTLLIMPYALRLVLSGAVGIDPTLEHAASSLGASRLTTFRRITLPLLMPGVVSGWVLAFITSFDELTMSIFLASPSTVTLPVRLYNYIEETIDPLVTSVSAVLIILTMLLMAVLDRIYGLERLMIGKGQ
ncbi:ABC transporter permease [Marinobacterium arenosum]|uniref:ABC transporter permease n=1 Tax=Marinobacterium arenosum TaxID=2862496 RepID=UPI001C97118B|nr:ABC transporter permease [Marinobacterium arenosum]MBY4676175.1 ABC transporter permease [Marinobacterium arenosum]